jgi:hypothetical protein
MEKFVSHEKWKFENFIGFCNAIKSGKAFSKSELKCRLDSKSQFGAKDFFRRRLTLTLVSSNLI